ncbi:nicotinate-nucleotide--dimethylbenzimidazole phosphoribosyltransferase [Robiginitomaculum antarcticum]|uniref:nicotinate-nucleotide--dimethylbenzimidazole phosphoribosyltransferase n=1 Tax=Robiginitomaculum antarcticum TaxID=437507 RepID=UPI000524FEE4|nr:nicotinate-nucleotide--dimethylbenzimidazole phosphoribosyltransferase [Robiginitomaculum antarcticum]
MTDPIQDGAPFDDIRALINSVPPRDNDCAEQLETALGHDPLRFLGDLSAPVTWLAGWQGTLRPDITRPLVAVFVGSHGVAQRVLDTDPAAGAAARVKLLTEGPASVRSLAATAEAAFKIFELGTEVPCADMTEGPSLSERDCAAAIAFGMEVVAEGADVLVLGNAGYGAATAAAAVARGLYGGQTEYWAGGSADIAPKRIAAVSAATKLHSDHLTDPLEILARMGGRDISGMVGALLAARHQHIPVLLDGFVCCTAAAILHHINPDAIANCYAAHATREPGHKALLERIGKPPFLDLGIGVGDGSGAILAMGMLQSACRAATTMADGQNFS